MHVAQALLSKGYSVRGAVRTAEKGKHLKEVFASYGDKFELVVVPDITKEGAFDEAVKGVDAIAHTASPVPTGQIQVPAELIDPAVKGTTGILKSAIKNAPGLQRIVTTSSIAAVMNSDPKQSVFTENDWNDAAVKNVEEKGVDAGGMAVYQASKTLAERAAWDLWKENKDQLNWDITTLCPPFVFGPPIHEVSSLETLNASMKIWWNTVVVTEPTRESVVSDHSWIDVRDLATAHVLALETPAAGGERLLVSSGKAFWQDWIDAANSVQPSPLPNHKIPKGFPDVERVVKRRLDTKKEQGILGLKYKSKEDTARDILEDFAKRGW
ncbi:D-lactaldehyde dehydrogenase [Coprinopsis sp. MPI-PUGE-AT-0042]|nr:D-lactaldehyde dehydrogenase [Coprinopsis sp. MPI-PUGE-AT-0042]